MKWTYERIGATAALLLAATVVLAATSSDRLKDTVIVGSGAATVKTITFDVNNGATNALISGTTGSAVGINTTSPAGILGVAAYSGSDVTPFATRAGTASGLERWKFLSSTGATPSFELDADFGSSPNVWQLQSDTTTILTAQRSGNIGLGAAVVPNARLDMGTGVEALNAGLTASSSRPAVSASRISGEIAGYSSTSFPSNDGFLRLSAGGGTNAFFKSYIDLSGLSSDGDMDENIVFGTAGSEKMRLDDVGRLGIGTDAPGFELEIANVGADVTNFVSRAGTPTGSVRQKFMPSNANTPEFEIDADFGSSPNRLLIQSDTNTLLTMQRSGLVSVTSGLTVGGNLNANGQLLANTTGGNVPHGCFTTTSSTTGTSESTSCTGPNEQLLGGGCNAAVGLLRQSYPSSSTTWQCTGDTSGTLTAYAICCLF